MKREEYQKIWTINIILLLLISFIVLMAMVYTKASPEVDQGVVILPHPDTKSYKSFEGVLLSRRSVREFSKNAVSLKDIAQLLWAAQGITSAEGKRNSPSAGALYPLELYVLASVVNNLTPGIYKYVPRKHELHIVKDGDLRNRLYVAALLQKSVRKAPANLVFSAVYERTTGKYGDRGKRYVHMEVGHAAQNVYLQSGSLGLGTVVIGAFHDDSVKVIIGMPSEEQPLYIMPVGHTVNSK